jgi:hypothetical protein
LFAVRFSFYTYALFSFHSVYIFYTYDKRSFVVQYAECLQLLHSFFIVLAADARKAMEAGQGKGSGEASHHRLHL